MGFVMGHIVRSSCVRVCVCALPPLYDLTTARFVSMRTVLLFHMLVLAARTSCGADHGPYGLFAWTMYVERDGGDRPRPPAPPPALLPPAWRINGGIA